MQLISRRIRSCTFAVANTHVLNRVGRTNRHGKLPLKPPGIGRASRQGALRRVHLLPRYTSIQNPRLVRLGLNQWDERYALQASQEIAMHPALPAGRIPAPRGSHALALGPMKKYLAADALRRSSKRLCGSGRVGGGSGDAGEPHTEPVSAELSADVEGAGAACTGGAGGGASRVGGDGAE